eukprot:Gb_20299 [translate_table: standard]
MEKEMEVEVWKNLPDDFLVAILARLPIRMLLRYRVVCKRWNFLVSSMKDISMQGTIPIPVCSTPAFLIELRRMSVKIGFPIYCTKLLAVVEGSSDFYTLPFDFLPTSCVVVASCKSLLCCCCDAPAVYICNPFTRTWVELPAPNHMNGRDWDFIALSFDSSAKRCTLVMGSNFMMLVEMYDSYTNSWTQLHIFADTAVHPRGEGIYSRGRFYWINHTDSSSTRCDVVALNIKDGLWEHIDLPPSTQGLYSCSLHITGQDGGIVLVYTDDFCMWNLNEETGEWSALKVLTRCPATEQEFCDTENDSSIGKYVTEAVMNESGWILVHVSEKNMVVLDAQGRLVKRIEGRELAMLTTGCLTSVRAFEVNNIWWP